MLLLHAYRVVGATWPQPWKLIEPFVRSCSSCAANTAYRRPCFIGSDVDSFLVRQHMFDIFADRKLFKYRIKYVAGSGPASIYTIWPPLHALHCTEYAFAGWLSMAYKGEFYSHLPTPETVNDIKTKNKIPRSIISPDFLFSLSRRDYWRRNVNSFSIILWMAFSFNSFIAPASSIEKHIIFHLVHRCRWLRVGSSFANVIFRCRQTSFWADIKTHKNIGFVRH